MIRLITFVILAIVSESGFSTASTLTGLKYADSQTLNTLDTYIPRSHFTVFDQKNNASQMKDLHNIDYNSGFEKNGAEWNTQFDAKNLYNSDEEDIYNLEINRFYISYKNKETGIRSILGRQASPGTGVVGAMDGVTFQAPVVSRSSMTASAGFPLNALEKDRIQRNKPFFALNVKLPGLYKSLTFKPYVVVQYLDGFLNRQSVGSELNFTKNKKNIYQVLDYDTQFNELNMWLIRGQVQENNETLYYASVDYRRNPALDLDNALINEYRTANLKELSTILSYKEIIAQAKDRTAKNYSANIGSSFPLSSHFRVGADIKRYDQIYKIPNSDDVIPLQEHNYQNEVSAQLVATNLIQKRDTLELELEYINAKYFTNRAVSISDKIYFSELYQLNLAFSMTEGVRDNGELILTTMPTATLTCQCAKRLFSEFEVGYENWNYSGNTQQIDESQVYANINFRLEL